MKLQTLAVLALLFCSACTGGVAESGSKGRQKVAALDSGGTWGSSGGELIKDTQNPWWVENTKDVTYCVDFDVAGMSTTRNHARAMVSAAIGAWQKEFAQFYSTSWQGHLESRKADSTQVSPGIVAGVGTQTFTEIACTGAEDLRFKFGYGTLTAEDLAKLPNPQEYVAMAVRTEYDRRTLRGRGFIFVGSDTGPNTIDRAGELLDDSPWQTDMVLYGVLLHEMGHVFGIPHLGQRFGTIMAAEFPELLLMKAFQPILAQVPVEGRTHFFVPGAQQSMCFEASQLALSDYQTAKEFFGLPDGATCIRASAMASAGQEPSWYTGMQLESAPAAAGPWTPVGSIDGTATSMSAGMAVLLWLGPTQQIYDATQIAALGTYGVGPMIVSVSLSGGLFHPVHGADAAATYTVSPDGSTISGVLNGRIVNVLHLGVLSD